MRRRRPRLFPRAVAGGRTMSRSAGSPRTAAGGRTTSRFIESAWHEAVVEVRRGQWRGAR